MRSDSLPQLRLSVLVGQLGAHHFVDVIDGSRFVGRPHDQKDMCVWQASFLEFDDIGVRHDVSKHAVFGEVAEQLVQLEFKNSRDQVGSVRGGFPLTQVFGDLRPRRVGRHGDEITWENRTPSPLPLRPGSFVAWPAAQRGRKTAIAPVFRVAEVLSAVPTTPRTRPKHKAQTATHKPV